MVNTHRLEAPSSLFGDIPAILDASDFHAVERRRESIVKGVRRLDQAEFDVTNDSLNATLWIERRLGNRAMFIMVVPGGMQFPCNNEDSGRFADRIITLMIQHGAFGTVE